MSLTPDLSLYVDYLAKRAVPRELAEANGVRFAPSAEWQGLKARYPGLPHPGGEHGEVDGILIEYPRAKDGADHIRIRALTDKWCRDTIDGSGEFVEIDGKWFAPKGQKPMPWIPDSVHREKPATVVITEAPLKALSVFAAGHPAIGMAGVEAGTHDPDAAVPTLHSEMSRIDWRGTTAIVLYDENIHWNPGVARGAARLARALLNSGAKPRIAFLPRSSSHDVGEDLDELVDLEPGYGPDDFHSRRGKDALRTVLEAAVEADPVERVRRIVESDSTKEQKRAAVTVLLGELYFQASLKFGGSIVLDNVTALLPKPIGKKALREAVRAFDDRVKATVKIETPDWMGKLRTAGPNSTQYVSSIDNAVTILTHDPKWHNVLTWNDFTHRIEKRNPPPFSEESGGGKSGPWEETDDTRLVDYLGRIYGMTLASEKAYRAAEVVAQKLRFHPVRDAIDAIVHDGVSRIDTWLSDFWQVEDTPYTRRVGRYFLLQLMARIYEPGCKADYVLVLVGTTGFKKSQAIGHLLPDRSWISDTPFAIGTKDAFTAMRGKVVQELAELVTLMRSESNASKAFFSSSCDHYRPPYGHHDIDVPRSSIYVGTINPEGTGIFRDQTGNRRYWPVEVMDVIDLEKFVAVRDQLLAEARDLYRAKAQRYPTHEENQVFAEVQAEHTEEHAWHELIAAYVDGRNRTTVAEVLGAACLGIASEKQNQHMTNLVATILKNLGFRRRSTTTTENGKRTPVKFYERIEPVPEPHQRLIDAMDAVNVNVN